MTFKMGTEIGTYGHGLMKRRLCSFKCTIYPKATFKSIIYLIESYKYLVKMTSMAFLTKMGTGTSPSDSLNLIPLKVLVRFLKIATKDSREGHLFLS